MTNINDPGNRFNNVTPISKKLSQKADANTQPEQGSPVDLTPSMPQVPPSQVFQILSQQGALNFSQIENVQITESVQRFMSLYPPSQFDKLHSDIVNTINREFGLPQDSPASTLLAQEALADITAGKPVFNPS